MNRSLLVCACVSVLATLVLQAYSQDACMSLRDDADFLGRSDMLSEDGVISEILAAGGDTSTVPTVKIVSTNIVCEAQHMVEDRYRYTSVVVSFNCFSTDTRIPECADSSVVLTEQFDLGCVDGQWSRSILTVTTSARTTNPTATLTTELDTGCILCINPTHPTVSQSQLSVDSVTHCVGCADCTIGLQRCYYNATFAEVCCNYFHNDICVVECPTNYAPNDEFECERQCPEIFTANGQYSYTRNRLVNGTAILTCVSGYEAINSPATCQANRIWSAAPRCDQIVCPAVNVLDDGQISYSVDSRIVDTVVSYECNNGFYLVGDEMRTCMSNKEWTGMDPSCSPCRDKIEDCIRCTADKDGINVMCTECEGGNLPVDNKCPTKTTTAPSTGGSCDTPCIIGIILAIVAVIIIGVVVTVVAFVLYKYLNDPATKLASTGTGGLNGVARDNPLYVDPAAVTDEGIDGVPTETTPLEA